MLRESVARLKETERWCLGLDLALEAVGSPLLMLSAALGVLRVAPSAYGAQAAGLAEA